MQDKNTTNAGDLDIAGNLKGIKPAGSTVQPIRH